MNAEGVAVHLHYFSEEKNNTEDKIQPYCASIHYYKRNITFKNVLKSIPYIVQTRNDTKLLENIQNDDFPILFEGLHTTFLLNHPALKNRKKIVRLHNIEWLYYGKLFDLALGLRDKLYFYFEYKKLIKYQSTLENSQALLCLSTSDTTYYTNRFPNIPTTFIPAFHQNTESKTKIGRGEYILFHGNLSITDNYLPIVRLLKNQLKNCQLPIIIAGKNPTEHLIETVQRFKNIQLISNPSYEDLETLIQDAHINIIFSEIETGVKLKLINTLFLGRFCFTNHAAIIGSELQNTTILVDENNIEQQIKHYFQQEFTTELLTERIKYLSLYNNKKNSIQIISYL